MSFLWSVLIGLFVGVYSSGSQPLQSCPYTESSYYLSDVTNRCVFYWCVKGQWVLPRPFQCGPGSGTKAGYHGYGNPCTEHVSQCSGKGHSAGGHHSSGGSIHSTRSTHGNQATQPVQYGNQAGQPVQYGDQGGQPVQYGNQGAQPVQYGNQGGQPVQYENKGGQPVQYGNQGGQPVQYGNQAGQPVQYGNQAGQPEQYGSQGGGVSGHSIIQGHHGGQSEHNSGQQGQGYLNKGHYHHGGHTGQHPHGSKPHGTHYPLPDNKYPGYQTKHPLSPKIVYKLDGYHVPFGDIISGINDVNYCLHACLKNTSCHGFDFNFRSKTCWFHTQYTVCTNPVAKADCAHFKLVHCASTSTSSTPTTTQIPTNPTLAPTAVFPDMCISGGDFQPLFTTEQACQDACILDPNCEGIDFDQNTGSCFFHSSGTECGVLTPQTGCVHYRYVDCATGTLMAFPTTHALGGVLQPSLTDPADCITSCQGINSCVAIDYDSSSKECFFHDALTCSAVNYKLDCVHIRLQNCP